VDIARNACQKKRESKMFIIYANPQYIDILRTKRNDIISELDSDVGIQIVSDSNIKSGGCRVENEDGFVDATLESMLKKIGLEVKGEA
jgi:flagellar assembly protein FliH